MLSSRSATKRQGDHWASKLKPENTTDTSGDNRVFNRTDWAAAGLVTLVALTIYFVTLAPTVTLEQSGAFIVAGQYLGIGRVPGYPLWHLLAKGFITIFGFVRYRGYPNPAWATNFMSAVFGALSCGLIALLVARTGRAIASPQAGVNAKSFPAALAAGILFSISRTMWSQSIITETHTLTLFCILLFLVAALVWISRPCRRSAFGLAAVFGLGLAQSHIVVLLLPCLVLALLLAEPRLCREFCLANMFIWILPCILLCIGMTTPWFWVAVVAACLLGFALPLRLSAYGSTALGMLVIIAVGVAFYAYLPLASEGNPPMQFGYARTWEGFKHVITRGQYERIKPTDVMSLRFLEQLRWYAGLLGQQYLFPLVLAAFFPLVRVSRFRGPWLKWWGTCLLAFTMFSVVVVIGANPYINVQDSFIQRVKFIPSFALWGIFIGLGFMIILDWISRLTEEQQARRALAKTT